MKFRAKYIGLLVTAMLAQSAAHAATVFMLQFGSYQSAEEAQTHLNELKTKHVGALSRLETSVRPVTLPPDSLVVYRTQAGPLATRADAQAVCSQLVSNGDSCYIVETAIGSASNANSARVASLVPSPSAPTKSTEKPSFSATSSSKIVTPDSTSMKEDLSSRDSENIATLNSVSGATALSSTTNDGATSASEDSVVNALDEAAAKQNSTENTAPSAASKQAKRSFWERINPFASDTPQVSKDVSVAPNADATQAAAPVEAVIDTTPSLPALSLAAPVVEAPPVLPAPSVAPLEKSTANTHVKLADAAIVPTDKPVVALKTNAPTLSNTTLEAPQLPSSTSSHSAPLLTAPPYPLPPPPAPLSGYSKNKPILADASTNGMPLPTGVLPNANVRVEEAKRVPLSQSNAPVVALPAYPTTTITAPSTNASPAPAVDLSPSATLGQRTIWAQIGQFASPQDALAFWNHYRQSHPDFPVVRVRVTTPLAAQKHEVALVNLRVGPFAKPEFITNLCTSITQQDGLMCGAIADLGVAVNPYTANGAGQLSAARYKR